MNNTFKLILLIIICFVISIVVLDSFAFNDININSLLPNTLNKTISFLQIQLSNNNSNNNSNNDSIINTKLLNNTHSIINNKTNSSQPLKVVASFFPIYEFVKAIGGDKVQASVLIPIGSEPHNFDPTIQEIRDAQNADMIIYNGAGLESGWINKINAKLSIDTSQGLNLLSNNNKESSNSIDPHIWLDPILAQQQVNKIRDGLIKIDPNNANYYKINAQKFITQLQSLDSYIKSELSNCNKKDFISFHNAFNYFAKRYGLTQHSLQGISPEGEILPQKLQEIIQLSHTLGINIIYSEELVDPRAAQVIANEIPNGKVLILSPIEGVKIEEQKAGIGYLDKMKQDLVNLKMGLQCNNSNDKVNNNSV